MLSVGVSDEVSTHSRLKAAGRYLSNISIKNGGFNTQPPEGGWLSDFQAAFFIWSFNTQPPEGGWNADGTKNEFPQVSTHSRLKAAGQTRSPAKAVCPCFNTQPPEGGWLKNRRPLWKPSKFQHTAA